jgi:hypothetical protein
LSSASTPGIAGAIKLDTVEGGSGEELLQAAHGRRGEAATQQSARLGCPLGVGQGRGHGP